MTNLKTPAQRYRSLDVLRGLTIALMIVVNTPGDWSAVYAPFKHAAWHGFTPTDLVFPTFLFVVGNAMSFSFRKMADMPGGDFFGKLLKRSIMIFAIGVLLNYFPFADWSSGSPVLKNFLHVRIFGVLQRIALCYLLAGVIIYFLRKPVALVAISISFLAIYWALLYSFGLPGSPYALETNAAGRLDRWLLPVQNLYKGLGIAFDPEGLLSTLPATVNVIGGYLTGIFIIKSGNSRPAMMRLLLCGAGFLLGAWLWNAVLPVNKPIWTSSYVLCTIGWDLLLLGALMGIIDLANLKGWTYFFEAFGKNPLFIYILAWIIMKTLYLVPIGGRSLPGIYYKDVLSGFLPDKAASLVFAISYMLLLWLFAWYMDKKKIYVKV